MGRAPRKHRFPPFPRSRGGGVMPLPASSAHLLELCVPFPRWTMSSPDRGLQPWGRAGSGPWQAFREPLVQERVCARAVEERAGGW